MSLMIDAILGFIIVAAIFYGGIRLGIRCAENEVHGKCYILNTVWKVDKRLKNLVSEL